MIGVLMPEPAKTLAVIGVCLAAAWLGGCAKPLDLASTPPQLHPFAASELSAAPIPRGVDLIALRQGERVYQRVDETGAPPVVHAVTPSTDAPPRMWIEDRLNRQQRQVDTADGRLALHTVIDDKFDAHSTFAEPLINLDPALSPGESITVATQVRVRSQADLSKEKDRGESTNTVTYDGRQRLNTPAGEFDCYRFTSEYRGKFDLASVTSRTIAWYADGVGLVAQVYSERLVMLVLPVNKRYAIVLSDYPTGG